LLRFAPSPTKDMDIKDLRIALFNHILSKQLNEELLIRIDDTDKEKNIEGKDKEILEQLTLFGIDYSRVIIQSENIKYHTGMGMKLLLDKKAFNCFCSDEALDQDKEKAKAEGKDYSYSGFCETISDETKFHCNAPFVVRIKKPQNNIEFTDVIKGKIDSNPDKVDSFIILNHEKVPTYNFASAIDDMLYNITTIIRDEKYLLDTPKQIHLRASLGYDQEIKHIHLPDIKNSLSINYLIDKGYLPIAIANYVVSLGTNTPTEIFSIEEACEWFDINKISKEIVEFDINQLNKINKIYIKDMDELRLSKIIGFADEDIGKLAKIYLTQCNTIEEIKEKISAIFSKKPLPQNNKEEFTKINECLQKAPFIKEIADLEKYITEKTGLENEQILNPLKVVLTGSTSGPDLKEIYPLIRNYLGEIIC
jgi:glutamyl-tRNA synthetase